MNTKGYLRKNVIPGVKVIIHVKCCCFYLVNYAMYGFVPVIVQYILLFINVLNTKRVK